MVGFGRRSVWRFPLFCHAHSLTFLDCHVPGHETLQVGWRFSVRFREVRTLQATGNDSDCAGLRYFR